MGEFPNKPTQFKPGESGNPKGRPKGTDLTSRLRRILEENEGQAAEALMKVAVKAALEGDWRFWNSIVERVEGKVAEKIQPDGELEVVIRYVDATKHDDGDG